MEYKGYKIEGDGTFGMYRIRLAGRGKVHAALRGAFTRVEIAKKAIDTLKVNKEVEHAKAKGTSGV